jgi:TonB family protein
MTASVMRKLLLAVALPILVTAITPAQAPDPGTWQRFRVANEHFSVLLPALPVVIKRGQFGSQPTGTPPFGLPTRKDGRTYAAYREGVVYLVIAFDNPKPKETLEFFFQEQLGKNELRNVLITARSETSQNNLKVIDYKLRKYDYQRTSFYPGVLQPIDAKNRAFAILAIGKDENDPAVNQFLHSFESDDQPNGIEIGKGADSVGEPNDAADQGVSPKDVSRKAMIIIKPPPSYTPEAREKRLNGSVTLTAVLNASGRVTNIQAVSGLSDFFQTSTEAAEKICFIPAIKDGRFVSITTELVYTFNIY